MKIEKINNNIVTFKRNEKDYAINVSSINPQNRMQNFMYFVDNISNVNKNFLKNSNTISFNGNLTTFTKGLITNSDISKGCSEISCHDAIFDRCIRLEKILTSCLEPPIGSNGYGDGMVQLKDFAFADTIKSYILNMQDNSEVINAEIQNTVSMSGKSKAKTIITRYIEMFKNSQAENVYSSNLELRNKSKVKNLFADDVLSINGEGTVDNIICKGHQIYITGPINVTGKIKFDFYGEVFLLKNENTECANIANKLENGIIKYIYDSQINDISKHAENLFGKRLQQVFTETNSTNIQENLGNYKDIASICKTNPNLSERIKELSQNNSDEVIIRTLYNNFAQNTCLNLTESNKKYTAFWAENKKIGDKNLVDFWLSSLNISIERKSPSEKADILNALPFKQKQKLIENTIEHWVNNILPVELNSNTINMEHKVSTADLMKQKQKFISAMNDEIFKPLKDFDYLSSNTENSTLGNKIETVFDIIEDNIKNSPLQVSLKVKSHLDDFNNSILAGNTSEIESNWLVLINTAQDYFETHQINKVLAGFQEQNSNVQKTLDLPMHPEIKSALEDKYLNVPQKAFIARYKDNRNLVVFFQTKAIDIEEDLNSLIINERFNDSIFDAMSYGFRKNLALEIIDTMPEMTNAYIRVLGFEPNRLTKYKKYELLANVPSEELELVSRDVKQNWTDNFLSKHMSGSILEKVRAVDAGYQSAQMAKKLDTMIIQLDGQQHTLKEISQNIDHFIDVYKVNSAETNNQLSQMAKTMEDIHLDTSNIRTNVKAMLFQSIQSTKDPVLKNEMGELLQDADRMELSQFLQTVEEKQRHYDENNKMSKVCGLIKQVAGPALLIGGAFATGPFAGAIAPFLMSHGAPMLGNLISSGILGHAFNTAIQCSNSKVGFIASLATKARYGDVSYGEHVRDWIGN
jgi:hypothetical protein